MVDEKDNKTSESDKDGFGDGERAAEALDVMLEAKEKSIYEILHEDVYKGFLAVHKESCGQ